MNRFLLISNVTVNIFASAVCSWFHFMNMVWTTADCKHSFVLRCSHWSLAVLRGRREQSQAVTLFEFSLRIQCCLNLVSRSRAVSSIVSGSRAVQTLSLGARLFKHILWDQGCSNPRLFKYSLRVQGYSDLASEQDCSKYSSQTPHPKFCRLHNIMAKQGEQYIIDIGIHADGSRMDLTVRGLSGSEEQRNQVTYYTSSHVYHV